MRWQLACSAGRRVTTHASLEPSRGTRIRFGRFYRVNGRPVPPAGGNADEVGQRVVAGAKETRYGEREQETFWRGSTG
jgi:hypothetical protein